MTKIKDIPGDHVRVVRIPEEGTAGDADVWSLFEADSNIEVTGVAIIWDADITGAATNNFAVQALNEGTDGTGTTGVTDVHTYASGEDATAQVPEDLTLSSTDGETDLDEGEVLSLARTVNGTGLASPSGVVQVTYRYR